VGRRTGSVRRTHVARVMDAVVQALHMRRGTGMQHTPLPVPPLQERQQECAAGAAAEQPAAARQQPAAAGDPSKAACSAWCCWQQLRPSTPELRAPLGDHASDSAAAARVRVELWASLACGTASCTKPTGQVAWPTRSCVVLVLLLLLPGWCKRRPSACLRQTC
jgi:hypothetical protein